jgi:hypothetical protein
MRRMAETRTAFGQAFTIWLDRLTQAGSTKPDRVYTPPERFDLRVEAKGMSQFWTERALALLRLSIRGSQRRPSSGVTGRFTMAISGRSNKIFGQSAWFYGTCTARI